MVGCMCSGGTMPVMAEIVEDEMPVFTEWEEPLYYPLSSGPRKAVRYYDHKKHVWRRRWVVPTIYEE